MSGGNSADEVGGGTSYVYRCFNSDFELLYVGLSDDVKKRLQEHKSRSLWFPMVGAVTAEECENRVAAEQRERIAIAMERPKFNVVYAGCDQRAATETDIHSEVVVGDAPGHEEVQMFLQTEKLSDVAASVGVDVGTLRRIRDGKHKASPLTIKAVAPVLARLAKKGTK